MTQPPTPSLLPIGLYDLLPPDAAKEQAALATLLHAVGRSGYQVVTPPLAEYEDNVLTGKGAALAAETFRLTDPLSPRALALRADMTMPVARIAVERLAEDGTPVRLAYAGPVLRARPQRPRALRGLTQAGIELVGDASADADAEVILTAVDALHQLGFSGLSVDLNMPGLAACLLADSGCLHADGSLPAGLARALAEKQTDGLSALPEQPRQWLTAAMRHVGAADAALHALEAASLPPATAATLARHRTVIARLRHWLPDLPLTLDPLESRGFEYHRELSFSIFCAYVPHELGRGGRYDYERTTAEHGTAPLSVTGTGFTLNLNPLLRYLPNPPEPPVQHLPPTATLAEQRQWQDQGYVTIRVR